jgi:hypothetical protein
MYFPVFGFASPLKTGMVMVFVVEHAETDTATTMMLASI